MAVRFDQATQLNKVTRTDDGRLHCSANFCRDGILEYRTPDGNVRRELRLPEENEKAIESFKHLPISIEHPPGLLDSSSYKQYAVGMTDGEVVYQAPFVAGKVSLFDSEAIDYVDSGKKREVSLGYKCDIEKKTGTWNGEKYDAIQRNIRANHLALTAKGRAGEKVGLRLDSLDDADVAFEQPNSDYVVSGAKTKMATIRLDGVEYSDIPEHFASIVGKMSSDHEKTNKRLDSLESELKERNDAISDLKKNVQLAEDERDTAQGRSDALMELLTEADSILSEYGVRRDSLGNYKVDADNPLAKKMKQDKKQKLEPGELDDEEEYYEDDNTEEFDLNDFEVPKKGKKKKHKKDEKDEDEAKQKHDSAADLIKAYNEATKLLSPETLQQRLDSNSFGSVRDIHCAVIKDKTGVDVSDRNDSYIEGVYTGISVGSKLANKIRADGASDGTGVKSLEDAVNRFDYDPYAKPDSDLKESDRRRMENWKKGLAGYN